MNLRLRPGTVEDAKTCGTICYNAFKTIAEAHSFPPDFPSPDVAIGVLTWMLSHPGFYSVVAELDGRIVGSNFLDERSAIAGVGPITIDPSAQNKAVGRRLMEDVHERAARKNFAGVRLLQSAYHTRSLSLYTKLGYDVRETLACLQGPALNVGLPRYSVRPAKEPTSPNAIALRQVHGHDRGGDLLDAINKGATVVEHDGRITGYATVVGFSAMRSADQSRRSSAHRSAKEFAGPVFCCQCATANYSEVLERGLRVIQR